MSLSKKILSEASQYNDIDTPFPAIPFKGHNPSHMRFVYGRHQNSKEDALENAKAFLEAVFMFRAKTKSLPNVSPSVYSIDNFKDKNLGAILNGVPKEIYREYQADEIQVKQQYPNIASRCEAASLYRDLQHSKLVGGSYDKPRDLSQFTSLVQLHLK